jgi:hypothetical protein
VSGVAAVAGLAAGQPVIEVCWRASARTRRRALSPSSSAMAALTWRCTVPTWEWVGRPVALPYPAQQVPDCAVQQLLVEPGVAEWPLAVPNSPRTLVWLWT